MRRAVCVVVVTLCLVTPEPRDELRGQEAVAAVLPPGVHIEWDLQRAHREASATRERICINGLWRWQPAQPDAQIVPDTAWGYFKVPGGWPGITDYMQKDCQTIYLNSAWSRDDVARTKAAWYQRDFVVPANWSGRDIVLQAEYVNSLATVFVDGQQVGTIRYPAGELDVTRHCRPGDQHRLSMLVVALPLQGVMLSYNDTAAARETEGRVERRGLCGDVFLASKPAGPRFDDVQITTSVRKSTIELNVALDGLVDERGLTVQAKVLDGERILHEFTSPPLSGTDLTQGRLVFGSTWMPEKLWDIHTPANQYQVVLILKDSAGGRLDELPPTRFGFREFWIDGRDFYLNGTRIFLSSVPLDNAQVGAAWASYEGARESMRRLASFGINFVYTHNYGCEPGSHLAFSQILRAADDVGMLVAFSQPHFAHYQWDDSDADTTNGYAAHAEFYVRAAQNHPAVVAYATSHNATGYGEDMNPDMIDGRQASRNEWSLRNVRQALRAEAIIRGLDPSRIVYHHASGNLGAMHTSNFYANFVPIQEMSDWFEHWSREGVKPFFTCEYSVPMPWDWAMYRGWYRGEREFGSAVVPWELCVAEWNAQFFGDRAYQISEAEAANLRWESRQFAQGRRWHRWDYPHQIGSSDFLERYPVYSRYFADNWPAFRTWEVSANSPWNHSHYWTLRPGVNKDRQLLEVSWPDLQRPGFSADYVESRYETMEMAYERDDWVPTEAAQTLMRYNRPLLGYVAGKPDAHTSKEHLFRAGEAVDKQLIVINNSRNTVQCDYMWSLALPQPLAGRGELEIPTGEQRRVVVQCPLPAQLAAGQYELQAEFRFSTGEVQESRFSVDVVPPCEPMVTTSKIALFDPLGETRQWLSESGVKFDEVTGESELSSASLLIVGKGALTVDGSAPDITRVREGLKVVLFEQTPEVLERRFGFRVAAQGLREVFTRVPDHPLLRGISPQSLRDWRGASTILPPRLDYMPESLFSDAPTVRWCGIPVARAWRCGNRGNVASVLIEKPARGDFLTIVDGGFSLQYSPLLEYREGRGMVLFCQLDVTGRTEREPIADQLLRNLLTYADAWRPAPRRRIAYVGDQRWATHLERAGFEWDPYDVNDLDGSRVLVVGPGGGAQLAGDKEPLATWLAGEGRVLCLGLDAREANQFLAAPIQTQRAEHISCWFEPPGASSALAGIGPADVHQAAPRELPLVSGGASTVGNGVLAISVDQHIVFCQFDPEQVDADWGRDVRPSGPGDSASTPADGPSEPRNLQRTYRRVSCLISRLLGNLGVAGSTPLLERCASPVETLAGASLLKNGDLAAREDEDGVPEAWQSSSIADATCRCEKTTVANRDRNTCILTCPVGTSERKPTSMLAQQDVPVKKDQWYRIDFWARSENLSSGGATVALVNTRTWTALIDYQRFEPRANWQRFEFEVQAAGSAERDTRFQIWFEGTGELRVADVRFHPIDDPAVGRWLEGFYLDRPSEWDDPYRFFRW